MRQYTALAALALAVTLAASACGSGKPAAARAQPSAILDMVTATSITRQGVPVHPPFTFPPAQPQITVIAQVGKVTRSPLAFTWFQVKGAGARKLFSRTVQVSAWERAYSVGKDPGPLATGTYRVTASAGGQTQATTVAWPGRRSRRRRSRPPPPRPASRRSMAAAASSSRRPSPPPGRAASPAWAPTTPGAT